MTKPICRFFVYGTLLPGHSNFMPLEPYVSSIETGKVTGKMYSCNDMYPVVLPVEGTIVGSWLSFDPNLVLSVLNYMDHIEGYQEGGTENLYNRVIAHDMEKDIQGYMYVAGPLMEEYVSFFPRVLSGSWEEYLSKPRARRS